MAAVQHLRALAVEEGPPAETKPCLERVSKAYRDRRPPGGGEGNRQQNQDEENEQRKPAGRRAEQQRVGEVTAAKEGQHRGGEVARTEPMEPVCVVLLVDDRVSDRRCDHLDDRDDGEGARGQRNALERRRERKGKKREHRNQLAWPGGAAAERRRVGRLEDEEGETDPGDDAGLVPAATPKEQDDTDGGESEHWSRPQNPHRREQHLDQAPEAGGGEEERSGRAEPGCVAVRDAERRAERPLVVGEERGEPNERTDTEGRCASDSGRARERREAEDRRHDRVRELRRDRIACEEPGGGDEGEACRSAPFVPEHGKGGEAEQRRQDVREEEGGERK